MAGSIPQTTTVNPTTGFDLSARSSARYLRLKSPLSPFPYLLAPLSTHRQWPSAVLLSTRTLVAGPARHLWTGIYNTATAVSKPLPCRLSKRLFNCSCIVLSLCIPILSPWVTGILPSSTAPVPLSTPPQTTSCPNHFNILLLTSGSSLFLDFSAAPQIPSACIQPQTSPTRVCLESNASSR